MSNVKREAVAMAGGLKVAKYRVQNEEGEWSGPQYHMTWDNTVMALMGEECAKLFVRIVGGWLGSGWKSMDSAPRDGTPIKVVLEYGDGGREMAFVRFDEQQFNVGLFGWRLVYTAGGFADKVLTHWDYMDEFPESKPTKTEAFGDYGKCPVCGADGVTRERRPNGNDTCPNGHTYTSANAKRGPDEIPTHWDYMDELPEEPEFVTGGNYGYCPECGVVGLSRERRPNGNDTCMNGHVYPSADAIPGEIPNE